VLQIAFCHLTGVAQSLIISVSKVGFEKKPVYLESGPLTFPTISCEAFLCVSVTYNDPGSRDVDQILASVVGHVRMIKGSAQRIHVFNRAGKSARILLVILLVLSRCNARFTMTDSEPLRSSPWRSDPSPGHKP
jgi:hypothetical protein